MRQAWWEAVRQFLTGLNIGLPYKPAAPLQGIHTKELKAGPRIDICTAMFIATLFTRAKGRTNPRVPQWIMVSKVWQAHTVEC